MEIAYFGRLNFFTYTLLFRFDHPGLQSLQYACDAILNIALRQEAQQSIFSCNEHWRHLSVAEESF